MGHPQQKGCTVLDKRRKVVAPKLGDLDDYVSAVEFEVAYWDRYGEVEVARMARELDRLIMEGAGK